MAGGTEEASQSPIGSEDSELSGLIIEESSQISDTGILCDRFMVQTLKACN